MLSDSWKRALKLASEDLEKNIAKKYKFFLASLAISTNFLRPLFDSQFFLSFNFYFGHKAPRGLKHEKIMTKLFVLVFSDKKKAAVWIAWKEKEFKIIKKKLKIVFFDFFYSKIHKEVGELRRRLFLQLSETQFTGLRRRQLLPGIAARWGCIPLIKKITAHYNSQFCVSFHYCFHWKAWIVSHQFWSRQA